MRAELSRIVTRTVADDTQIGLGPCFEEDVRNMITIFKPKKFIETGTYDGMGSTSIIAGMIEKFGVTDAVFFSIEVNPEFCELAKKNLEYFEWSKYVVIVNGLSIKREDLPTREAIEEKFKRRNWPNNIYIDYAEDQVAKLYHEETDFPNVPDNQLFECMKNFDFQPDFVLLDSGGHVGELEFEILINNLKGPCLIALDDIDHVKHFNSYQKMLLDLRFQILRRCNEKFGHCFVLFRPEGVENV